MHEGVKILNYLVPKAFLHENGRLTGMCVRESYGAEATQRDGVS